MKSFKYCVFVAQLDIGGFGRILQDFNNPRLDTNAQVVSSDIVMYVLYNIILCIYVFYVFYVFITANKFGRCNKT